MSLLRPELLHPRTKCNCTVLRRLERLELHCCLRIPRALLNYFDVANNASSKSVNSGFSSAPVFYTILRCGRLPQ